MATEEKKINGNLALNGKERRVIRIEANHERDAQKLRVAAYCRVSSSSEDQLNSFAAQNIHYTQYIMEHDCDGNCSAARSQRAGG